MIKRRKAISDYIDDNQEYLISHIQRAVQIKSLVGQEQAMQEFMRERYEEIGLETFEFQPDFDKLSKHEAFIDSGIPFDGRKNVIGILQGAKNGQSLTLHGHVDVVSPEPLQSWTQNPWGGDIVGNRLYGRGALDMKSGLLANWFSLKTLLDLGIHPEGTVQLHSTIEEEAGGGGGALACLEEGYVTDGFLTTEPHALRLTVAHVGIMYFRVKVFGKTAHASNTQDGVNAIGKMYKIYHALEALDQKRAKEVEFDLFKKGSGGQSVNLNLGTLRAGDWVSTVAGEAILECRIGFIPGETRADIKRLINETVANAIEGDAWLEEHPPEIEWFGWSTEAWYQDPNDAYVRSFKHTGEETLGRDIEVIGRTGGNDARFTQYYGKAGIAFGPRGANMHGPDEYVEIDSILDTAKVLANHILDWTKEDK